MPKVKDALGYLEKVKNKFASKPHVYNQFLDIMKDFKSQAYVLFFFVFRFRAVILIAHLMSRMLVSSIDTEGVILRVKQLFKGNRNLILGFNQFLPPGYKIEMPLEPKPAPAREVPPPPQPKPNIEFNHAVTYVAKIKVCDDLFFVPLSMKPCGANTPCLHRQNCFRDQPQIYSEFLDILHDYQAKRTIDEVYQRVQILFSGHPDLLEEFKYFLPDHNAPPPPPMQQSMKRPPKQPAPKAKSVRTDRVRTAICCVIRADD